MKSVSRKSGTTSMISRAAEPMTTSGRTHDESIPSYTRLGFSFSEKVGGTGTRTASSGTMVRSPKTAHWHRAIS